VGEEEERARLEARAEAHRRQHAADEPPRAVRRERLGRGRARGGRRAVGAAPRLRLQERERADRDRGADVRGADARALEAADARDDGLAKVGQRRRRLRRQLELAPQRVAPRREVLGEHGSHRFEAHWCSNRESLPHRGHK
jgi:hypothetical protein